LPFVSLELYIVLDYAKRHKDANMKHIMLNLETT